MERDIESGGSPNLAAPGATYILLKIHLPKTG